MTTSHHTRMPTAPCGGGGCRTLCDGGWGTIATPSRNQFPSAGGWHVVPGWLEITRNRTYSPLSSRAKRGDPVNKKALRAFARRHIALDCHSRTPTFSTLIVLLRNDSDICPAVIYVPRICADIIYTLNSTLSTLLLSRCA